MNSNCAIRHACIGVGIIGTVMLGVQDASADNPECSSTSPRICVQRNGPDPELDTDFRLDFTNPSWPDITLLTGNTGWKVWSQVSISDTTPANIGDIVIDATFPADVFEMSLLNATGGPGAANVGSIILSDATNWTGHSSITAGHITGNLAGDLVVAFESIQGLAYDPSTEKMSPQRH